MPVLHGSEDWYSLTRSVLDMKFLTLDDTPDTYATQAGKGLKVSGDEAALVFSDSKPDAHHVRHETAGQDQVDHGGLAGLADDDHVQYLKEEASGGLASEVPDHTHQAAATCGKLDHGLALDGLGDDDHPQYILGTKIGVTVQAHSAALDAINSTIINAVYPVGCIYTSIVATNPGTLFGVGTWAAFGAGRVPVGFDAGQTEFDTVEETGGEKTVALSEAQIASHFHTAAGTYCESRNADVNHDHTITTGGASADHTHQTPAAISDAVAGNVAKNASGWGVASTAVVGTSGGRSADHTHSGTTSASGIAHKHGIDIPNLTTDSKGSGNAHNNLPPYIVVYMFKRTA